MLLAGVWWAAMLLFLPEDPPLDPPDALVPAPQRNRSQQDAELYLQGVQWAPPGLVPDCL